jgi:Leucine-rich repeat (LRR) protein
MWNSNFINFNHNLSSWTSTNINFDLFRNPQLVNFTLIPPPGLRTFQVYNSTSQNNLKFFDAPSGLLSCTILDTVNFQRNQLTGWTYNFPPSVRIINFFENRSTSNPSLYGLSSFTVNLSSNTALQNLNLSKNRLTSITNTIIGCTSLTFLDLSYNELSTIPILPNSVQNLNLEANGITSLPPMPTGLTTFNANTVIGVGAGINTITTWTQTLTTCPNLTTFSLNGVSLSSWTTQFPSSIKNISLVSNNLTTFNFSYINTATGVTLNLSNNFISTLTNLNSNISLLSLDISTNQLNSQTSIIPLGNSFPSSLTGLTMNLNPIGTWSTSFAGATSLKSLLMTNCNLNQASVDYILCNLNSLVNAVGGLPTGGTLNLGNQPNVSTNFNSTPSGPVGTANTGLWCKAQLQAAPKSWFVTTV